MSDSLVWKSMIKGKETLLKGACRAVRSGESINIWIKPWRILSPNQKSEKSLHKGRSLEYSQGTSRWQIYG